MLIRSQNRKFLVSMEQAAVEYKDEVVINTEKENVKETQHNLYIKSTKMYSLIGEYSTEEKAIKVLDMIQNAYLSKMVMVFQMPKDSEVM